MKQILFVTLAFLLASTSLFAQTKAGRVDTTKHVTYYSCSMHPDVVSTNPGVCPQCKSKLVVDRRGSKQAATVYTCGMHPDVASATAGKCPVCGMEMVAKETKKD